MLQAPVDCFWYNLVMLIGKPYLRLMTVSLVQAYNMSVAGLNEPADQGRLWCVYVAVVHAGMHANMI